MLTDEDFLAVVGREGDALLAAAEGHLDESIPAIEDWTVADVAAHMGEGDQWVVHILSGMRGREAAEQIEAAPARDELMAWVRGWQGRLATALADIPDGAIGWTLNGRDRPLRFWRRRRAHENTIHRWDIESAAADPRPIDPELAVDGIDEMFEVFTPRFPAEKLAGNGETLHLHATDTELEQGAGEWLVTRTPGGLTWEHGHAKGDVAARGTASDLLLFLWNRIPPSRLEVFGDADLLDHWQSTVRI